MPAPTLREYFAPDGRDFAGVRRIPITTSGGTFSVWTRRTGHNPRTKVLLLHGGSGGGHETIETAIAGRVATTLLEGQRRVAVADRFPEESRRDIQDVERLLVRAPGGERVPLGERGATASLGRVP